jgi:epoxyqueuosine reductase QueG
MVGSVPLSQYISAMIARQAAEAVTVTDYRPPLVGFAAAEDLRLLDLRRVASPTHLFPRDLLQGARSIVSFFLPFAPWVVEANAQDKDQVAREWAVAYVETNDLIGRITARLIEALGEQGIRAAAEPATHNFDRATLVSHWSHKSVAVIAGLGSFGLHHMVITDSGCAGRFGSLVLDADLPIAPVESRERCLYFEGGSCLECVLRCPAVALDESEPIDRQSCWQRCLNAAERFQSLGQAEVCGKCAIGPCSLQSAVQ